MAAERVALVEGEAGVGKTRLVDELLRRVVADGGLVLRGRNDDTRAGLPYGLVVEALRAALKRLALPAPIPNGWPS